MPRTSGDSATLQVEGRSVTVSNLQKPMYPVPGFTKGQVIDFYIRASVWLLPHLEDRPVTMKRYPNGVAAEHFYEKDAPSFTPNWVRTVPVPRRAGGPPIRYIVIDDLATLVWAANLANLEIHPFLHRAPHLNRPTSLVFDLDPGEGFGVLECCEVALLLRDVLSAAKLRSIPKFSGSKGVQVYVPLNSETNYAATQPFAKSVAELLAREHPRLVVSEMAKAVRKERVFIDWSQNSDYKTTVGVYSLRAKRQHPFVSMPATWQEIERAHEHADSGSLYWQPGAAIERLEKLGDLFAPALKWKQKLPAVLESVRAHAARRISQPARAVPQPSRQGGRRRFVIQQHAAKQLHYDFRLEMHDVLKSWAVPKGLPYATGERRLAMETEDHPLAYLDFEGVIPAGQYGGGTVLVWDIGTYDLVEGNYYKGVVKVHLDGKKLKGEWTIAKDRSKGENAWTIAKSGGAARPVTDHTSARSGRTLQQIAQDRDRVWRSDRALPRLADLPESKVEFVEPMKAQLVDELPDGEGWQYEIKLDGYRALALRSRDGVRLLSRNNNSLGERFPSVVKACEALPEGSICDGEVVALDENGRPSFSLLQNWGTVRHPLLYYVFDLLVLRGKNVQKLLLTERRALLAEAMNAAADPLRLLGTVDAPTAHLIEAARQNGIEGFVAKRTNSLYEPGLRSGAWVKYKVNQSHELVIGGYIPGGKHGFESLLVGYYEARDLIFIAKVRNGFVPETREAVFRRFKGLETDRCPFANLPEPRNARRGEALTAEVMTKCRWLKPKLVAQIEYTDWTDANHLRHSRFAGLREDKDAREVVREHS